MDDSEGMAPAVEGILASARERGQRAAEAGEGDGTGGPDRVAVDARSLPDALASAEADGRVPVIAEVKPTSPTTEGERTDDPVALAEGMVAGGAAALSVLTEPDQFGGSTATLEAVREAVDVPVLRKDFVVREAQLDAVAADVVLLIARFLDEPATDDLEDLLVAARDRGFQVLVETHSVAEVERAVDAGASIVGVNNRDLAALEVDLDTFESVAPAVPDDVTLVAESGIEDASDVVRMRAAGADAVLVGSAIMAGDVTERTRTLATAERDDDGGTRAATADDAATPEDGATADDAATPEDTTRTEPDR